MNRVFLKQAIIAPIAIEKGSGGGDVYIAVIDDLTSHDTSSALSANQGRILNEKILALAEMVDVVDCGIYE